MRKKAELPTLALAALFLVPSAWATVNVVDADGTEFRVEVVGVTGSSCPDATALNYTVLPASGSAESGLVDPTQDPWRDQNPVLFVTPGVQGPVLLWERNDGVYDQIAYSRFMGGTWTDFKYLTSGPRDHVRFQTGVDSAGRGYVLWVEPDDIGRVMFATFDPATGNLMMSARNLFQALLPHSPPVWLTAERPLRPASRPGIIVPKPEGGNDGPAVPPVGGNKDSWLPGGDISLAPTCPKAAAAVVRQNALWIGILEGGVVLNYYRSVIPAGAGDDYVKLLLETLLSQHCQ